MCKAPVKSSLPTNQHPNFYRPDALFCNPTNRVKALKGNSAVTTALCMTAICRWAQHRSSGAVVTVQRVWRRLQIFRLTYLLTQYSSDDLSTYPPENRD